MKHVTISVPENFSTMTKNELHALVATLSPLPEITPAISFAPVPAVPAVPAVVDNGITTMPEKPAIAGKSTAELIILAYPSEYGAYKAAVEANNKANEDNEKNITSSPDYLEIASAKKEVATFEEKNKSLFEEFTKLATAKSSGKLADVKAYSTFVKANPEIVEFTGSELFMIASAPLPTFTPAPAPSIDDFFPNGISENKIPASCIVGLSIGRAKVAKVAGTTTATGTSTGQLTDAIKLEIQALRNANIANGLTPGKGLSTIEQKYGISHGTAGGYIATLK